MKTPNFTSFASVGRPLALNSVHGQFRINACSHFVCSVNSAEYCAQYSKPSNSRGGGSGILGPQDNGAGFLYPPRRKFPRLSEA